MLKHILPSRIYYLQLLSLQNAECHFNIKEKHLSKLLLFFINKTKLFKYTEKYACSSLAVI